ncbi:hypothetical protein VP01_957g1 [Puccinia sorghi]|uniref:Uncharacterized protein n=1 Tax=Puccinia sorghi TaxID=27349 RepID=A0A0L6U673_9BASI|nr:hypothetical protein VP01_957g1 [Puccinia sorghi]
MGVSKEKGSHYFIPPPPLEILFSYTQLSQLSSSHLSYSPNPLEISFGSFFEGYSFWFDAELSSHSSACFFQKITNSSSSISIYSLLIVYLSAAHLRNPHSINYLVKLDSQVICQGLSLDESLKKKEKNLASSEGLVIFKMRIINNSSGGMSFDDVTFSVVFYLRKILPPLLNLILLLLFPNFKRMTRDPNGMPSTNPNISDQYFMCYICNNDHFTLSLNQQQNHFTHFVALFWNPLGRNISDISFIPDGLPSPNIPKSLLSGPYSCFTFLALLCMDFIPFVCLISFALTLQISLKKRLHIPSIHSFPVLESSWSLLHGCQRFLVLTSQELFELILLIQTDVLTEIHKGLRVTTEKRGALLEEERNYHKEFNKIELETTEYRQGKRAKQCLASSHQVVINASCREIDNQEIKAGSEVWSEILGINIHEKERNHMSFTGTVRANDQNQYTQELHLSPSQSLDPRPIHWYLTRRYSLRVGLRELMSHDAVHLNQKKNENDAAEMALASICFDAGTNFTCALWVLLLVFGKVEKLDFLNLEHGACSRSYCLANYCAIGHASQRVFQAWNRKLQPRLNNMSANAHWSMQSWARERARQWACRRVAHSHDGVLSIHLMARLSDKATCRAPLLVHCVTLEDNTNGKPPFFHSMRRCCMHMLSSWVYVKTSAGWTRRTATKIFWSDPRRDGFRVHMNFPSCVLLMSRARLQTGQKKGAYAGQGRLVEILSLAARIPMPHEQGRLMNLEYCWGDKQQGKTCWTFRTTTIGPRFLDLSICSLVSPFLLEGEELTGVLNVHRNITSSICTPGLERQNRTQRNSLKVLIRTEPVAYQRFVRGIFLGNWRLYSPFQVGNVRFHWKSLGPPWDANPYVYASQGNVMPCDHQARKAESNHRGIQPNPSRMPLQRIQRFYLGSFSSADLVHRYPFRHLTGGACFTTAVNLFTTTPSLSPFPTSFLISSSSPGEKAARRPQILHSFLPNNLVFHTPSSESQTCEESRQATLLDKIFKAFFLTKSFPDPSRSAEPYSERAQSVEFYNSLKSLSFPLFFLKDLHRAFPPPAIDWKAFGIICRVLLSCLPDHRLISSHIHQHRSRRRFLPSPQSRNIQHVIYSFLHLPRHKQSPSGIPRGHNENLSKSPGHFNRLLPFFYAPSCAIFCASENNSVAGQVFEVNVFCRKSLLHKQETLSLSLSIFPVSYIEVYFQTSRISSFERNTRKIGASNFVITLVIGNLIDRSIPRGLKGCVQYSSTLFIFLNVPLPANLSSLRTLGRPFLTLTLRAMKPSNGISPHLQLILTSPGTHHPPAVLDQILERFINHSFRSCASEESSLRLSTSHITGKDPVDLRTEVKFEERSLDQGKADNHESLSSESHLNSSSCASLVIVPHLVIACSLFIIIIIIPLQTHRDCNIRRTDSFVLAGQFSHLTRESLLPENMLASAIHLCTAHRCWITDNAMGLAISTCSVPMSSDFHDGTLSSSSSDHA